MHYIDFMTVTTPLTPFFIIHVKSSASFSDSDGCLSPVHESQDVEHGGHVRVIVTRRLLQVFQSLFTERHSHLVSALRRVLNHEVVQSPETRRDLVSTLLSGRHRCTVVLVLHCGGQRSHEWLT